MADKFRLSILTPRTQVFDDVVSEVTSTGHSGEFGVLPGHYSYITSVKPGALVLQEAGGGTSTYAIGHGFAQIAADKVSIVVNSCEEASTLNRANVLEQQQQAEATLMDASPTDSNYTDALIDQEMALGRLHALDRIGA